LQNDLTLARLANAIGTNRTYLSQHFAHSLLRLRNLQNQFQNLQNLQDCAFALL
jgi:hypothetical protein